MSAVSSSPEVTLEQIAKEIEAIQGAALLRIGDRLHAARDIFKHKRDEGGFRGWVETRLSLSRTTAYKLIGVFERFGAESVQQLDTLPATVLYALAAPSTPEPVREAAVERAKAGETITAEQVREMKRTYEAKLAEKNETQFAQLLTLGSCSDERSCGGFCRQIPIRLEFASQRAVRSHRLKHPRARARSTRRCNRGRPLARRLGFVVRSVFSRGRTVMHFSHFQPPT